VRDLFTAPHDYCLLDWAGLDGCIASWTTCADACPQVSGKLWMNYLSHWTTPTSGFCKTFLNRNGSMHIDFSNVWLQPFGHFGLKNWQKYLQSGLDRT
jgi:hypothetical protein